MLPVAPADEAVARGALPGGGAKAQQRDQAASGADPVAQLRTGEGLEAEVVVAVDEFIPQAGVRTTGCSCSVGKAWAGAWMGACGSVSVRVRRRGCGRWQRGGGSWIKPSFSMRSMATRQDISFSPPSCLSQPNSRQASRDRSARVRKGSSAINALTKARSCSLKSRPQ